MPNKKIICIEGPHGIGKTVLCSHIQQVGYHVMKENFIPEHNNDAEEKLVVKPLLEPQSIISEFLWVADWFDRVLDTYSLDESQSIIFSDRSPISALIYSNSALKPIICKMIEELEQHGFEIHFVRLIPVGSEFLWNRVKNRLEREPYRERYNEGSKHWLNTIIDRYNQRMGKIVNEHKVFVESSDTTEDVYNKLKAVLPNVI